MPAIFISHSSKDNLLAHALAERLREQGYDCFLDFQGIPGGAQWEQEIYIALRRSLAVLVCATPEAMDSRWVFAEIVIARYSGIPVIPLVMKSCELPANIQATELRYPTWTPVAIIRYLEEEREELTGPNGELPIEENIPPTATEYLRTWAGNVVTEGWAAHSTKTSSSWAED